MSCDIAFVVRPSEFVEFLPFPHLALTSCLKQEGLRRFIIDANPLIKRFITINDSFYNKYFEYVKSEILRLKPRFVGIGAFTSDYDFVMHFSKEIKRCFDGKIIVGNVHATIQPEDFLFKGSPVDMAVIGEGELTVAEILSSDDTSVSNLNKISGICFYDDISDRVVVTNRRKLIRDLSILPVPSYSYIDMSFYTMPERQEMTFDELQKHQLKTLRAYNLKELFRYIWDFTSVESAREFFNKWFWKATHSRLEPMREVAHTLKRHLEGIIAYADYRVTNNYVEGMNNKIKAIYNGFIDSDQNGSQFKVYLLTI